MWIAFGGAIGASARYLVAGVTLRTMGPNFPWGTLIVNIVGSFFMGALIAMMALRWNPGHDMRLFLTTGILGGFTTFSAFSLDVANLVEKNAWASAAVYASSSVIMSIAAVFAGLALMRWVLT